MADKKVKEPKVKAPKTKAPKKRKLKTYQQRQDRNGYAFMAPWIIGFLAFTAFPFVMTIYLSFTHVKATILGYDIKWVGLANYNSAFFKSETFVPALLSYLQMIIPYTFIVVVLSFIIAYLLCKINVGKSILRTIYFLPVIIMSGPVMTQILNVQDAGQAATTATDAVVQTNAFSDIFIMQIIQSYSPAFANGLAGVFDHLSIILWFTGIPIVLFINGLQKINPSIYEAAKIDSANAWQIMWKITIPMLKSIGLIITVFTVIQLGMYESINPVYELIKEQTGKTDGGLGYAATYSWIYSILALLIIGIVFLLFKDRKPKDIKARQKQEKKLKKLDKQQKRRLAAQKRHQRKEAKRFGK
ncbi:MAG: sugar ABC transporter permease [Eubacterium sp.]|nr:sugar ABC transporter permease [Eubacterium sp.]